MPATSKRKTRTARSGRADVVIPDKLYFRIGEVAKLLALPTYVLRFWETEFPQLKPNKSSTGQRMYRRPEVEFALRIKKLLYEEGFTIPGARQHLKSEARGPKSKNVLPFSRSGRKANLKQVRDGLKEVLAILGKRR